ncbi:MAG: sulfite oxidase-like oxidoreductase [Chloroflexi bacterium]|nr:sulfite oxidase-like oxidoreductase [Chloroflexota bacterium]
MAAKDQRSATPGVRLPPGQSLTEKFPVLSYGATPRVELRTWRLEVRGLVEQPYQLSWAELRALPAVAMTADFHCVTGWSRLDNLWEGVRVRDLLERARPRPGAAWALATCYGGYTTDLPLEALLADNVLIACRHDGRELEPDHGGPARLVIPSRYGYKSAKWIAGLEILERHARGFWEKLGYHSNADPWQEERYSSEESWPGEREAF